MNNLNSILIEGNLVRDPEYKTTSRGTSVTTFQIASNRYYRQDSGTEKETGFFNVESWGKLAESVGKHGKKGRGARVVGRLKQERWQDREGKAQSKVVIVAEHVEFRPDIKKTSSSTEESEAEDYAEEENCLEPTF